MASLWLGHIPHGEAAEPNIRAALTRALIDEGELDDTCDDDDIGLTKVTVRLKPETWL